MINYYIGNTLLQDTPDEYQIGTDEIVFDDSMRFLYFTTNPEFVFYGDGYGILRDLYNGYGYANRVQAQVTQTINGTEFLLLSGWIYLSDIVWNEKYGTASVKIRDDFEAQIKSNWEVSTYVRTTHTKNGVLMTAATQYQLGLVTNYATPTYGSYNRASFDIYNAMQKVIEYATDGAMTVYSDYYENQLGYKILIMTGLECRTGADPFSPQVSFKDLAMFMIAHYNVKFGVEIVGGDYRIRMEPESYWESAGTVELSEVEDISITGDIDQLYSGVLMGSVATVPDDGATYAMRSEPFYGFSDDRYVLNGVVNVNSDLDLRSPFITDHNAIQDLYNLGSQEHDDRIVAIRSVQFIILQYRPYVTQWQAGNTNYLYNEGLRNVDVLARWRFYSDVEYQGGSQATTFGATSTLQRYNSGGSQTIPTFIFDDYASGNLLNQQGNVYARDTAGSFSGTEYTVGASGYHQFLCRVILSKLDLNVATTFTCVVTIDRHDSGGVFQNTLGTGTFSTSADTVKNTPIFVSTGQAFCTATDLIRVKVVVTVTGGGMSANYDFRQSYTNSAGDVFWNFFACIQIPQFGGVVQLGEPDEIPIELLTFTESLSTEEWLSIRNNLSNGIIVNGRTCYVRNISRNRETGETTFELTSRYAAKD